MKISQARLNELLSYDPDTGELRWKPRPIRPGFEFPDKTWNPRFAGKVAGCVTSLGYRLVGVTPENGTELKVLAHRLIWMMVHGVDPEKDIDHVNGIGTDNRLANLRLATHAENMANGKLRKDNTSGMRGVSFQASYGKWRVRVNSKGKQVYLAYFDRKEDAMQARIEASSRIYGEFCPILSRGQGETSAS